MLHLFFIYRVGVLRFEVVLEEAEKVYYSGHEITGRIHLDLKEPLEAKCELFFQQLPLILQTSFIKSVEQIKMLFV